MNLDHARLEQVIPAANVAFDIETYDCGSNKVRIIYPHYNVTTGDFKWYEEIIGLICAKGDPEEVFFNYGHDEPKLNVPYLVQKKLFSNTFLDAKFTNCKTELLNQPRENTLKFFSLPS